MFGSAACPGPQIAQQANGAASRSTRRASGCCRRGRLASSGGTSTMATVSTLRVRFIVIRPCHIRGSAQTSQRDRLSGSVRTRLRVTILACRPLVALACAPSWAASGRLGGRAGGTELNALFFGFISIGEASEQQLTFLGSARVFVRSVPPLEPLLQRLAQPRCHVAPALFHF